VEERGSYDAYLTHTQGFDYVTWNGRLASTAFCEEGDCGYRVSGHEDRAGVHGEVWRRRNVAVYGMGESGTESVTSSAVSESDTFWQG